MRCAPRTVRGSFIRSPPICLCKQPWGPPIKGVLSFFVKCLLSSNKGLLSLGGGGRRKCLISQTLDPEVGSLRTLSKKSQTWESLEASGIFPPPCSLPSFPVPLPTASQAAITLWSTVSSRVIQLDYRLLQPIGILYWGLLRGPQVGDVGGTVL